MSGDRPDPGPGVPPATGGDPSAEQAADPADRVGDPPSERAAERAEGAAPDRAGDPSPGRESGPSTGGAATPGGGPPTGGGWPGGAGRRLPGKLPPRRRPLTVLLAVALVVVLSGGALLAARQSTTSRSDQTAQREPGADLSSVAPSTTPPPRTPEEIAARITDIEARVAEARGLPFERDVPAEIQPAAELAQSLLTHVDEETDETDLRRYGRALELLGQVPPGTDLPRLMRDLQAEGVLGYYVPGTGKGEGRLYVRGDAGLTPFVEWVLSHELTHAVTDQHFDLTQAEKLTDAGRDDEALAYSALVEGDATLLMGQYLQLMRPEDQVAVARQGMQEATPKLDAAPPVIQQALGFPYTAGHTFVRALYQRGGWDAVNRAYADPPSSSEQILHPEAYFARERDEPQPVSVANVAKQLGSGWQQGTSAGWGEADTRWLLAEELPNTAASGGADGWDGGALTTFERGRDTALVLRTLWDSPQEATEFCQTQSRWATERFGAGTPTQDGGTWTADGQHTVMRCIGNRAVWLSAPDAYTLKRLQATAGTP